MNGRHGTATKVDLCLDQEKNCLVFPSHDLLGYLKKKSPVCNVVGRLKLTKCVGHVCGGLFTLVM